MGHDEYNQAFMQKKIYINENSEINTKSFNNKTY